MEVVKGASLLIKSPRYAYTSIALGDGENAINACRARESLANE